MTFEPSHKKKIEDYFSQPHPPADHFTNRDAEIQSCRTTLVSGRRHSLSHVVY